MENLTLIKSYKINSEENKLSLFNVTLVSEDEESLAAHKLLSFSLPANLQHSTLFMLLLVCDAW